MKLFWFLIILGFSVSASAHSNRQAVKNALNSIYAHDHNLECIHATTHGVSNLGDIANVLDKAQGPPKPVNWDEYNEDETTALNSLGKVFVNGEATGEGAIWAEGDCKMLVRTDLHVVAQMDLQDGKLKHSAKNTLNTKLLGFQVPGKSAPLKVLSINKFSEGKKFTDRSNDWAFLVVDKSPKCNKKYGVIEPFDFKTMDLSNGVTKGYCHHTTGTLYEQTCTNYRADVSNFFNKPFQGDTFSTFVETSCKSIPGSSGCTYAFHDLVNRRIYHMGSNKGLKGSSQSAGGSGKTSVSVDRARSITILNFGNIMESFEIYKKSDLNLF